ncbi:hypothetical protein JTB14_035799 [Gonioctena quinquepunctata]|nr:hypothetical protein JTB14_035799 [Gonioctena quinquepunctata]
MEKARDNNKKISHEYGIQSTMVNVDFVNKNHHSKPSSQNRVRKSFRDRDAEKRQPERNHPKPMTRSCRKCGNQHGYGKCPAFGSIEDARGKEVDNLEVESWVLELEMNERPVEFKLDTGAMANVIPIPLKVRNSHITSSPRYSQSNGQVERAIQTVKNMFKKCFLDKRDPYLASLDLRNSPIDNENSPANILMNRNLRTILPQTNKIVQSKLFNKPKYDNFIRKSRKNMKTHYDNQGVKELKELKNNCLVKVQLKPKGLWESGRIVDKVGIRSYRIQMENNKIFIRNRDFIREDKKVHFQPSRTINTEQHDEQYKDNKFIEILEGDRKQI